MTDSHKPAANYQHQRFGLVNGIPEDRLPVGHDRQRPDRAERALGMEDLGKDRFPDRLFQVGIPGGMAEIVAYTQQRCPAHALHIVLI